MERVIDWWRRRRLTAPRIDQVIRFESQSELPDSLPRNALAVVGPEAQPKWAALECPCGAGHRLLVNLSPRHRPAWRLEPNVQRPGLRPSLNFADEERRCHFWLRAGKVRWCGDSRRGPRL
jgi:hypothetical protein